jgi:hypothetical protein
MFIWLISHQTAVLFSQNKQAISNQPAVLLSQNKPASATSHQPNEQAEQRTPESTSHPPPGTMDKEFIHLFNTSS